MANNASLSGLAIDISELSIDTTPQLGGNLDLNSNNITGTGNINTTGTITASGTITGSSFSGDGSSLSGINTDLVSDTTPQLGGNLDLNGNNITGTGNIPTKQQILQEHCLHWMEVILLVFNLQVLTLMKVQIIMQLTMYCLVIPLVVVMCK